MSEVLRFTKDEAFAWSAVKQHDGRTAAGTRGRRVHYRDFVVLLANHRRAQVLSGNPLLTVGLSDAIFAACYPGEQMSYWKRGLLLYVALVQSRHPADEADERWGTTSLCNDLLDASEAVPTMSDGELMALIARHGTARPFGERSIYARLGASSGRRRSSRR